MVQFSDQVVMLNVIWLFEDCVEVSSGLIHYLIDSMQCEMSSQETGFFCTWRRSHRLKCCKSIKNDDKLDSVWRLYIVTPNYYNFSISLSCRKNMMYSCNCTSFYYILISQILNVKKYKLKFVFLRYASSNPLTLWSDSVLTLSQDLGVLRWPEAVFPESLLSIKAAVNSGSLQKCWFSFE